MQHTKKNWKKKTSLILIAFIALHGERRRLLHYYYYNCKYVGCLGAKQGMEWLNKNLIKKIKSYLISFVCQRSAWHWNYYAIPERNICLNYDDAFVYYCFFFFFFLSKLIQENDPKTRHQELNFKLFRIHNLHQISRGKTIIYYLVVHWIPNPHCKLHVSKS